MTPQELRDKISHADADARVDLRLTTNGDAVLSVSMGDLQKLIDGDAERVVDDGGGSASRI